MSALFELWRKQHPHDMELDWLFYRGRHSFATGQTRVGHVPDNYKDWNALCTITQKAKENKKGPYDLSTIREIGHLSPSGV